MPSKAKAQITAQYSRGDQGLVDSFPPYVETNPILPDQSFTVIFVFGENSIFPYVNGNALRELYLQPDAVRQITFCNQSRSTLLRTAFLCEDTSLDLVTLVRSSEDPVSRFRQIVHSQPIREFDSAMGPRTHASASSSTPSSTFLAD